MNKCLIISTVARVNHRVIWSNSITSNSNYCRIWVNFTTKTKAKNPINNLYRDSANLKMIDSANLKMIALIPLLIGLCFQKNSFTSFEDFNLFFLRFVP